MYVMVDQPQDTEDKDEDIKTSPAALQPLHIILFSLYSHLMDYIFLEERRDHGRLFFLRETRL